MSISLKPPDQKVMVIIGASSDIGLATAQVVITQGAKLVLVARSEETLAEIVEQVSAADGEAIYIVADVGDRRQVEQIATSAVERLGRIDTSVNYAGVSIYGNLREVSEEDHRRLFNTNFGEL